MIKAIIFFAALMGTALLGAVSSTISHIGSNWARWNDNDDRRDCI